MWIMLVKKPPTVPSPPRMALFWSTPWPAAPYGQAPHLTETDDGNLWTDFSIERAEWAEARKIRFAGEDIRVFRREYSVLSRENLGKYLGEPGLYTLVPEGVAQERLVEAVLDGEQRPVYDAAKVDGCTHEQAMLVALEMDVTEPDTEVPPIGWYRIHPDAGRVFCNEWELVEDRRSEAEYLKEARRGAEEGRDLEGAAQSQGGVHVQADGGRARRRRRRRRGDR